MLGVFGSSSLERKLLISLTLDDTEVGAEWKQGGREILGRESGLEVPAMEPGASGHQLLLGNSA